MKREIRELVTVDGRKVLRCTFPDSRWYAERVSHDGTEENRMWVYVPSTTWILDVGYPKGDNLLRWWASKGFDEGERLKRMAGEKGSIVHQACGRIAQGGKVCIGDRFENPHTLEQQEISAAEYHCVMTFADWWRSERPEVIAIERTVWSDKYGYAGTEDFVLRLKSTGYKTIHVIDLKTSKDVYTSHELQVSSYKHADTSLPRNARGQIVGVKLGILQVGYTRNKTKQFKYTEVPDRFPLFLAAHRIWKHEESHQKPAQRDYPLEITL